MHKTIKYVFFNDIETAKRFIKLYGGFISKDYSGFYMRYFGEKCKDKIMVENRFDSEEINDMIKYIGLKKKKWNGKTCYVFE